MKLTKFRLPLLIVIFSLLYGCGKEDIPIDREEKNEDKAIALEVSPASLHFVSDGDSKELTVKTNAKSWNVVSDQSWCQVKKRVAKITVTAIENKAFVPPDKATLLVTAEGSEKKISIQVTQDAAKEPEENFIALSKDRVIIDDQGGSVGIGVTTNTTGWYCTSDESWCVATKSSDEGINITVSDQWNGVTPRKATITLFLKASEPLAAVTVYQDPPPELQLFSTQGNSNIKLPSYGGTITITVLTNVTEFTLGYVGDWLEVKKINDTQFTISSTPNSNSVMRPDQEVIVYAGRISQKLYIYEEEEENSSGSDDHEYSNPTGWD